MVMNDYTFSEDSGTVEVCAEISAPGDVLECDVVTTLTFTDANKAGKIVFFIQLYFTLLIWCSFLHSSRHGLYC